MGSAGRAGQRSLWSGGPPPPAPSTSDQCLRPRLLSGPGSPQQEHTEILHSLRFTLVFVQHVLEIAALKGSASEAAGGPEYQLQESVVADQISMLSREWGWVRLAGPRWGGGLGCRPPSRLTHLPPSSFAEQLVLYLKVAELLSSGLQTAIDQIRAGKLCLSSTVKQGQWT